MAGESVRMPSNCVLFENLVGNADSARDSAPAQSSQSHTHSISALLHSSPLLNNAADNGVYALAGSSAQQAGQRKRRAKREPMLALRPGSLATEMSSSLASAEQLRLSSMSSEKRAEFYARLREDTVGFLKHAAEDWQPGEECRRYTVLGDCFTCVRWQGRYVISGADVVRAVVALHRLASLGRMPSDRRRFEDGVMSDMRSLKTCSSVFIEPANSPLLRFLYRLNAARTIKRQKVFLWRAVPFIALARDAMMREARCEGRTIQMGPYTSLAREDIYPQTRASPASPPSSGSPPHSEMAAPFRHRVADMSTQDLMHMHAHSLMRLRAASIPCVSGNAKLQFDRNGSTAAPAHAFHHAPLLKERTAHSAAQMNNEASRVPIFSAWNSSQSLSTSSPEALKRHESSRNVMSVLALAAETALLSAEGNSAA